MRKKLTEPEITLLRQALATGGIIPKIKGLVIGGIKQHALIKSLCDSGLLKAHVISVDKTTRHNIMGYYLTQAGLEEVLANSPGHSLQSLVGASLNIRGRLSAPKVERMYRLATASCFFAGGGVLTCLGAIEEGRNPYVLGSPDLPTSETTLSDLVAAEMVRKSEPLPPVMSGSLFLTSRQMPKQKVAVDIPTKRQKRISGSWDSEKKKIRQYNDALGVLLDFDHQNAYLVTKTLYRNAAKWTETAYNSFVGQFSSKVLGLHLGTRDDLGFIKLAIELCDTPNSIAQKAEYMAEHIELFKSVMPFTMDARGMKEFKLLLKIGREQYIQEKIELVLNAIPEATSPYSKGFLYGVQVSGYRCYPGVVLDYVMMKTILKDVEKEYKHYVACFRWQVPIYEALTDPHNIIIIPEPD